MELSRKQRTLISTVMVLPVRTFLSWVSTWNLPSKNGRKDVWRGMLVNIYCHQDSILGSPRRHTCGSVCTYKSSVFKEGRPALSVNGIILQLSPKVSTVKKEPSISYHPFQLLENGHNVPNPLTCLPPCFPTMADSIPSQTVRQNKPSFCCFCQALCRRNKNSN